MSSDSGTLHDRLIAVRSSLNVSGIGKRSRNKEQGYNFRGIDDVLDAVGPAMTKAGITTTLAFDLWSVEHGTVNTKSGPRSITRAMCRCTIRMSAAGEVNETQGLGEASDYADKATNKAMSNAWKYAICLALQIPFVGVGEDPDTSSPGMTDSAEVIAQAKAMAKDGGIDSVAKWAQTLDDAGKTVLRAAWSEIKEAAKPVDAVDVTAEDVVGEKGSVDSYRDDDFEAIASAICDGESEALINDMIYDYEEKHNDKTGADNLRARLKNRTYGE